ncbi:MAG: hypothetical protein Q9171_005147 [Xanthocarpia ochracea]
MKPAALLLAFLPTLITADCFTGGEVWDSELAPSAIDTACKDLAREYRRGESRDIKLNQENGQCYVFELQRIRGGSNAASITITEDECIGWMNREFAGCDRGGSSSYTDWMFKADPNRGPC